MKRLLKALWMTPGTNGRWGLPIIFKGAPGTAKTSIVNQLAKECGLHVETVLASLRQPEDFLGLPIPAKTEVERAKLLEWMGPTGAKVKETGDGEYTFTMVEYAPPRWAVRLAQAKHGVAFFDEINTAPPSVQAALLRVVLEGVVGELQLPPTIRMVACMNGTEESAGGWDLAPPLANRFGHIQWPVPDASAWASYILGGGDEHTKSGNPNKEEERVLAGWSTPWSTAAGLITAFIRSRGDLLLKQPGSSDPAASQAWPSPRSWENGARALAGAKFHGLDSGEQFDALAAYVGTAAASEFEAYATNVDLPDTEALLDGKLQWKHDPTRLDRTCAVLSASAAFIRTNETKRKERAITFFSILSTIIDDAPDLCVSPASVMIKAPLSFGASTSPVIKDALARLFPLNAAIGFSSRR